MALSAIPIIPYINLCESGLKSSLPNNLQDGCIKRHSNGIKCIRFGSSLIWEKYRKKFVQNSDWLPCQPDSVGDIRSNDSFWKQNMMN